MKKIMALATFTALIVSMLSLTPTDAAALTPSVEYSDAQYLVCKPVPVADSDSVEDKADTSGKTVWAISEITAPEGYMFDPRPEAIAYEVEVHHMENNGVPEVTERFNGLAPTSIQIASRDHRGRSLRLGRTVAARNSLVAMAVRSSVDCIAALNIFSES